MNKISKYIAYLLRHNPNAEGLTMDDQGFVPVQGLISALNISLERLLNIVETDNKNRYEIDGTRIRARQGHSIKGLDLGLKVVEPPKRLYHGTSKRFLTSILKDGLKPMSREYVHLSSDLKTAINVGKRHGGELVVFEVNSQKAYEDGVEFKQSSNGVYLTSKLPVIYLKQVGV